MHLVSQGARDSVEDMRVVGVCSTVWFGVADHGQLARRDQPDPPLRVGQQFNPSLACERIQEVVSSGSPCAFQRSREFRTRRWYPSLAQRPHHDVVRLALAFSTNAADPPVPPPFFDPHFDVFSM